MQNELLISGFGGQGVMFAGQIMAYAAMDQGLNVTWIPSYGPEMRGGTANCTVVISDEEIGAPLVAKPRIAIVLNRPSLDKYEPIIKPGGWLFINASMIDRDAERADIETRQVPASQIAEELGDKRMANMVMLGALLGAIPLLPVEAIARAMQDHLPKRHQHLIPANLEALKRGEAVTGGSPISLITK
jgi:2-oxoglutarate ferredoxin oxidoreductase subunit gamma